MLVDTRGNDLFNLLTTVSKWSNKPQKPTYEINTTFTGPPGPHAAPGEGPAGAARYRPGSVIVLAIFTVRPCARCGVNQWEEAVGRGGPRLAGSSGGAFARWSW